MRLTRTPVRPRTDRRADGRGIDHYSARGEAVSRAHRTSCVGVRPRDGGRTTPPNSAASVVTCTGRGRSVCRRVLLVAELLAVTLLASSATAHADTVVVAIAGSVDEVLTNIRNWLMGILAGLATVFLTIGGVRRVFGGGDPGEQEKAKEAFKAAGIGYALAALAPLVVTVLKGIVGA
jgi:hypothetical protein